MLITCVKPIFHLATLFARREAQTNIRQHDWLKLAETVPTFLCVRANKFAKWKIGLMLHARTQKLRVGRLTVYSYTRLHFSHLLMTEAQYKQLTVGSLSSATCPPIFMQLTGQNNGETASPAFLLARKSNWLARTCIMRCVMRHAWGHKLQSFRLEWLFVNYSVTEVRNPDILYNIELSGLAFKV